MREPSGENDGEVSIEQVSDLVARIGGEEFGVLLPASATSCTIPKGIFAGEASNQVPTPVMLMMTAYGPESWITYLPKPADPKQPWNPEWSVRLRAKSSAIAMLGLDFGDMQQMDDGEGQQQQQQQEKPSMKGLLKGILGG